MMQSQSLTLVNAVEARLSAIGLTRQRIIDYSALLSGQVGRLIFSMVYFIVLARTLSLGDFGIFATSSAIGIVLSRLLGFGFISPLFRVATTKPSLIGVYTGGFILAAFASLPIIIGFALLIHWGIYSDLLPLETFLLIVFAEVICWRLLEATIIVCNGQNRYMVGSMLGIGTVALKAMAATVLFMHGGASLLLWAEIYFAVLLLSAVFAYVFFYPKQKLRWKPRAWLGRTKDAVGVSAAETLFYVQSELDKVLVLTLGGEELAGLYAIVMRLVDLTAMPLRALSTMLTQWIMRARRTGGITQTGMKLDFLVGIVSVATLLVIAALLSFFPNIVGKNIALGSSFLWLVVLVPAFRNSMELHTELLYGHERMIGRVLLLLYVGALKAVLLFILLGQTSDFYTIAIWLNALFAILYAVSAVMTYKSILGNKPKAPVKAVKAGKAVKVA